ncbi:MAG: hypothetical protein U0841_28135 [Chloroflexia bacterium]
MPSPSGRQVLPGPRPAPRRRRVRGSRAGDEQPDRLGPLPLVEPFASVRSAAAHRVRMCRRQQRLGRALGVDIAVFDLLGKCERRPAREARDRAAECDQFGA